LGCMIEGEKTTAEGEKIDGGSEKMRETESKKETAKGEGSR